MPNYRFITVSESVARWVLAVATRLLQEGTGMGEYNPSFPDEDLDQTMPAMLDLIPDDVPGGTNWRNALVMLLQYITSVYQHDLELLEGDTLNGDL